MSTYTLTAYFEQGVLTGTTMLHNNPKMELATAADLPDRVTVEAINDSHRNVLELIMFANGARNINIVKEN